ncbi:MAG: hypothetical protein HUU55_03925 [Myxococcales bacterium]|nr:hypothetical protein [Myxococcales bacterium]
MQIVESRRLTGPSLLSDRVGAALEAFFTPSEAKSAVVDLWRIYVREAMSGLGLPDPDLFIRDYGRAVTLGFSAPVDVLYSATNINEWALRKAAAVVSGLDAASAESDWSLLEPGLRAETNLAIRVLAEEAAVRGVPMLCDDVSVSLGYGVNSVTYKKDELPEMKEIPWDRVGLIPVAIVTGTNGKTTTTRLAAHILMVSGHQVGASTSDGIQVNGVIEQEGDWTGPGAARAVLRNRRITAAVLETARGGYLRRGLGVLGCDVAVVTNVAKDHLGDYGIDEVDAMASVKMGIAQRVGKSGTVVLNADDRHIVSRAATVLAKVVWFGMNPKHPIFANVFATGGRAVGVDGGDIVLFDGNHSQRLVRVKEIPVTFGGTAGHNLANALAATALVWSLGVTPEAIARGLLTFLPNPQQNPGRANCYRVGDVSLILDFAHNPHGVAAVLDFVQRAHPLGRKIAIVGQAGDRDEEALTELAKSLVDGGIHSVILRPVHGYLRGRGEYEIPEFLANCLKQLGMPQSRIAIAPSETAGLDLAFSQAQKDDVVLLLAHVERKQVAAHLAQIHAVPDSIVSGPELHSTC